MSAGFWRWAFQLFGDRFVPGWLGPHNNHWRGNYGVRYWQDGWQDIILGSPDGYLQRIARAGFDGVYLDKIDEFADMARENVRARPDMIAFVVRLAKTARALKPGFLVVPQNGEELLRDAGYRAVIDGLGKEDLLFGDPKERVWNAPDQVARNVRDLALLVADGKPVLTVEYVAEPSLLAQARRENERYRFIPHFADRTLDSLRVDAPATLDIGPRGR